MQYHFWLKKDGTNSFFLNSEFLKVFKHYLLCLDWGAAEFPVVLSAVQIGDLAKLPCYNSLAILHTQISFLCNSKCTVACLQLRFEKCCRNHRHSKKGKRY